MKYRISLPYLEIAKMQGAKISEDSMNNFLEVVLNVLTKYNSTTNMKFKNEHLGNILNLLEDYYIKRNEETDDDALGKNA